MATGPVRSLAILGALALACTPTTGDPADDGGDTTGSTEGDASESGESTAAGTTSDATSGNPTSSTSGEGPGSSDDDGSSSDGSSTEPTTESSSGEPAICGDGIVVDPEACDDGNDEPNDGCTPTCESQRVLQVSAAGWHTCAILDTGALRCWGNAPAHGHPEIYDDIGDNELPADVGDVAVGGTPVQVVGGWRHGCVLLDGGTVRCWGDSAGGELGYGNIDTVLSPESGGDVDVGGTVTQLASSQHHTCALFDDATVRCWGIGIHGQLGQAATSNIGDDETPASVDPIDVGGDVVQIATGIAHTCALLGAGNVRCWGYGGNGSLGYADVQTIGDDETPASAGDVDVGGEVIEIAAGYTSTCALLEGGTVRCWGFMEGASLGYPGLGIVGDDETPAEAGDVDVGATVEHVSVGVFQVCAVLTGDSVRCWGYGLWGNLGYGVPGVIGDDESPATAGEVALGGNVGLLDAQGYGHACAVLENGGLRCWGFGGAGQLGIPSIFPGGIGDNETPDSVAFIEVF